MALVWGLAALAAAARAHRRLRGLVRLVAALGALLAAAVAGSVLRARGKTPVTGPFERRDG
jgi:hypothetical protein